MPTEKLQSEDLDAPTVVINLESQELDMTELNADNGILRPETCIKEESLNKVGIGSVTEKNNYNLMVQQTSCYMKNEGNNFEASTKTCDNVKRSNGENFIGASNDTDSGTDEEICQDQNVNGAVSNSWRNNSFAEIPKHTLTKAPFGNNHNIMKSTTDATETISILGGPSDLTNEELANVVDQESVAKTVQIFAKKRRKNVTPVQIITEGIAVQGNRGDLQMRKTSKCFNPSGFENDNEMEDAAAEESNESTVEDADPLIDDEDNHLNKKTAVRKTPDRILRSHKKTIETATSNEITESSNDSEVPMEKAPKNIVVIPRKPIEIDADLEAWLNPIIKSEDGQKTVECRFCDTTFCNLRGYKAHSHLHKEKYVCGVCDARFIRKVTLKGHMQEHQREKPFGCHLCSAKFAVNGHLTRHLNLHAEPNRFKCPQCGACFSQKAHMKTHLRSHGMVAEKPTCLTETETEREVRLKPIIKNEDGQEIFQCRYCHKKFGSLKKYKSHSYYHKEVFECEVCHTRFSRNTSLKVHMRRHTGEKPFSCHLCESKFSAGGCLNRHLSLHTGKRPFKCPNCDACFSQKVHLNGHMHIHTMDRPFQCSVCGKRYTHKNNLNFHMKRHSQEKPCACLLCPAKFYSNYELRRHAERAHKKESTWSCSFCAAKFSDENDVKLHKCCKSSLVFKCSSCVSCFSNEKKLKTHFKHSCPGQEEMNT